MKRIIVAFLLVLNIGIADAADKTITSLKYVTNQLATKQDEIPAVDTNTVVTHTGTAGEIGEKGIYDSSVNYAEQQTSLVTAGDANTGINNALENEFICIEEDTDHTCLIWQIKNSYQQQILPTGYTALEYLESTGTQYIDTGFSPDVNTRVDYKLQLTAILPGGQPLIGARVGSNGNSRFLVFSNEQRNNTTKARTTFADKEHSFDVSINTDYIGSFRPSEGKSLINGTEYDISNANFVKTANNNIYLFATSGYTESLYLSKGKIYFVNIYQNNLLVRNLIPAKRNSDGVLGMYDLASNTFFTNQGSGTFVAGPVLDVYIPSGN